LTFKVDSYKHDTVSNHAILRVK